MDPQLCDLRKSSGFHLVASEPDPLPSARTATDPARSEAPYRIEVINDGPHVRFSIGGYGDAARETYTIIEWTDDEAVGAHT